jgi:hypothetical protein
MRVAIIAYLAATAFLSGCAFEGVVVEKRFRPFPFYDSVGVDGIYKFELRDRAGQIHSQMVIADVFASYEVGDYFNDLQPPSAHSPKDSKAVPSRPVKINQVRYEPMKMAAVPHRGKHHPSKTAKAHHRTKHVFKTANVHRHKKNRGKVSRLRRSPHHHA